MKTHYFLRSPFSVLRSRLKVCLPEKATRSGFSLAYTVRLLLFFSFFMIAVQLRSQEYDVTRSPVKIETDHPYKTSKMGTTSCVWQRYITAPKKGAHFMTLHFDRLELAEGDHLLLSTPDGRRSKTYDHRAKDRGAFYSIPFYDDTIVVKLFSTGAESAYGVKIDQLTFGIRKPGYSTKELSICGVDENENIKCVENTYPARYNNRTPVARIIVNGVPDATGFLFGSDGYFLTAYHFLETSQPPQLDFEWLYESDFCPGFCDEGVIEDVDYTMIKYVDNSTLDYALLRLHDSNGSSSSLDQYGYLQTRSYDILEKEPIYIIHHPLGHCKQIAYTSDQAADENGTPVAHPHTLPYRIGHYLDTQGGSSGAPIFSMYDNLVVALHKGGGCPNEAIRMTDIVASLQEDGLLPPGAIKPTCGDGADFVVAAGSTQTFAKDQVFTGNLFIEEGATATVNPGKVLSFGANNGIYIKPGGRLIMEAGSVLKNCIYSDHWRGVQVWGNIVASQYPQNGQYEQGYLEMKTGATIENAETAVMLFNPVSPGLTGGILVANGAIFRNNITSIDTRYYQNFYPYSIPTGWQGQPRDYFSTIKLCQFIVDDDFPHEDKFHAFINLMDVNGVTITGCSFTNAMTDAGNSIADWGYGIFATDAGFRVQGLCNGSVFPCNDYTASVFDRLGYGIYTQSVGNNRPYKITNCDFNHCFFGIRNSSVNGGTILFNNFNLGALPATNVSNVEVGISFENEITSFTCQENTFSSDLPGIYEQFGIFCQNTGDFNKSIRKNIFSNLIKGILTNGKNGANPSTTDEIKGLNFLCNQHANYFSGYDLQVGSGWVRRKIGLPNSDNSYIAAGNEFSANVSVHLANYGTGQLEYFYDPLSPNQMPQLIDGNVNTVETSTNTCPTEYCDPPCKQPEEIDLAKTAFYTSRKAYQLAESNYQSNPSEGKLLEMAYHRQQMDYLSYEIVIHELYDTLSYNQDTLLHWIENMSSLASALWLAGVHLAEGDTSLAFQVLEAIPNEFNLSATELSDFQSYIEIAGILKEKSVYELDSASLDLISGYDHLDGNAGAWARNILTIYGNHYPPEMVYTSGTGERLFNVPRLNKGSSGNVVYIVPNPASTYVDFFLQKPSGDGRKRLIIMDITGRTVRAFDVPEDVSSIRWDTGTNPSGIYYYQLIANDKSLQSGKIILDK